MNFLKKFFSKPPPEVAEVPPEFLQEDPSDWLIDLKGNEPSGGNTFSVRVQLSNSQRTGSAEILVFQKQSGRPQTAIAVLERAEIDRLFVILGFAFPQDIVSIASENSEGLPVTITIFSEAPFQRRIVTCNLAGWLDSKKSAPTAVEIGRILLEIKSRAVPA